MASSKSVSARCDLPIPAGPRRASSPPCPCMARCSAWRACSSSPCRPINGPRAAIRASRVSSRGPSTCQMFTALLLPFSRTAGSGRATKYSPQLSSTRSLISTWPMRAALIRRAAKLTSSPITVYSRRVEEPACPAKVSPRVMPMRCSMSAGGLPGGRWRANFWAIRWLSSCSSAFIARAALTAR